MPNYAAPLRDYRFCLYELFSADEHMKLPGFADFTPDVVLPALEEAAKFSANVIHPLNRSGDEEGCRLENGIVHTPQGFKEAYRIFCDGGWPSLTCDPAFGGQGMPHMINVLVEEMTCAANLSFSLYPGLTRGAYVALLHHGSEEQKALHLPHLVSGEWAGSMCLTEPHCGTDLGLLRSAAAPRNDDSFSITGTKMFISAGDHDLTANIVYLVLARLPDAPKGTKGISLFLVPKFLVEADGRLGERNTVSCGAIEHKMGIKASATCVMNFDGAKGWLVGEPHQGLKAMFAMMNTERIAVGIQGLGVAEASYQNAAAYARERLQGRAVTGAKFPEKPADPIVVHADVRRMLLTQRALVEGCRALALWTAQALDVSERHEDPKIRQSAADLVALLTPVVKAFLTDCGSEVANLGMQIFGGHGYIRANGQEQLVRDVRVTQIYEGSNGIQALDLVGRKLAQDQGRPMRNFLQQVSTFIAAKKADAAMAEFIEPLAKALTRLQQATAAIAERGMANPDEAAAAATEYLRLFALTATGYLWARMAELSIAKRDETFYRAKLGTARFYMERILPQTGALLSAIMAGSRTTMEFDAADF
ncbi:MAG TPA: acyl-CoA dehydrogenase C-terminal domain-containing protein [Kiloniellales bacterium]